MKGVSMYVGKLAIKTARNKHECIEESEQK